jgi:hypothetical protein
MLPKLSMIIPPATGETEAVFRDEHGNRQVWHQSSITSHQLDYFCLFDLHPPQVVWEHEGKYISLATFRYLAGLGGCPYPQPHL